MDCVENGINVVITHFANSSNNKYPKGKFENMHAIGPYDIYDYKYKVLIKDHPLFKDNPSITHHPQFKNRCKFLKEMNGMVEIVAKWKDKIPMIAIRYDFKGLITSIGFNIGKNGSEDGLEVVVNALYLTK